jgi:ribosomal protein L11 methyltransferase
MTSSSARDSLFALRLEDLSADPWICSEFLSALDLDFSAVSDKESNSSWNVIYFQSKEDLELARPRIEAGIREWRECGVSIGRVETSVIKKEDWAESWKKNFDIIRISPRLLIKPGWINYSPAPGEAVVEIDPGMSFGTGQHPTTRFCLEMIDAAAARGQKGSFLDAGCGSGILFLAAGKLGFKKVSAFDFDPDAVKIAAENRAKNNIPEGAVDLKTAAIENILPSAEKYDFIAANILSGVLLGAAGRIVSSLAPGGTLALAGILDAEYAGVRDAFTAAGLTETASKAEKEWRGGCFVLSV